MTDQPLRVQRNPAGLHQSSARASREQAGSGAAPPVHKSGGDGKKTRYTRGRRCPVCGGCDNDARGHAQRCHGFAVDEWVHCSREEHAGKAKYSETRGLGPTRRRGRARVGRSMRQRHRRFRNDRHPKNAGLSTTSMATRICRAKLYMRQSDIRTQRVSPSAGQMALAVTSRRKCSRALLRSCTGSQSYVPRAPRKPCLSWRARRMPTGSQA